MDLFFCQFNQKGIGREVPSRFRAADKTTAKKHRQVSAESAFSGLSFSEPSILLNLPFIVNRISRLNFQSIPILPYQLILLMNFVENLPKLPYHSDEVTLKESLRNGSSLLKKNG